MQINYNQLGKDKQFCVADLKEFLGKTPFIVGALVSMKDYACLQVFVSDAIPNNDVLDSIFDIMPSTVMQQHITVDFKEVDNDYKIDKVHQEAKDGLKMKVSRLAESIADHVGKRYETAEVADVVFKEPIVVSRDDIEHRECHIMVQTVFVMFIHLAQSDVDGFFRDAESDSFLVNCDCDCDDDDDEGCDCGGCHGGDT